MKGLFKVFYTYKSYKTSYYDGSEVERERDMFLEYSEENGQKIPVYVPTNRLSGFERATIKIKQTKYLRDMEPIELDIDIERNEISAIISLDDFLDNTLDHDLAFENEILEAADEQGVDIDDILEQRGYIERVHDNSYNYCSDLENDIDYKIYTLDPGSDYIYDQDTIVVIDEHHGLDARCGYSFKGIYRVNTYNGLSYFYDFHVRCTVVSLDFNEYFEEYDGDSAFYNLLNEYTIESVKGNDVTLKNKDGELRALSIYSPAYGV